jgi:hypothetical protein
VRSAGQKTEDPEILPRAWAPFTRMNSLLKEQTEGRIAGPAKRRILWIFVGLALFVFLILEMCLAGRQQSQTLDEANHIFAGYRYWMCSDFRANPEHPPMVKLVATVPLLFRSLKTPTAVCGYPTASQFRDYTEGNLFLYANDADSILFQTRLLASVFAIVLAALLVESGIVLFGPGPALLALVIFVFEPTILAHGFLVTTDMGMACCLYATVYAFYLYLVRPSYWRLLAVGFLAGTTLAAKHSGFLVFAILGTLAFLDLLNSTNSAEKSRGWINRAPRMLGAFMLIGVSAYVVLWGFYGFRFLPAPDQNPMGYALVEAKSGLILRIGNAIFANFDRFHLLPEAYLYGLKNVMHVTRSGATAFLFGKIYPHGRWFYFPSAFLIKSTLGFLGLLALAVVSWAYKGKTESWRKVLFLVVPPIILLMAALNSNLNIGIRHILPAYPFLIMFIAVGAWKLCTSRRGRYAVALLIAVHALSSLRSFPEYISYSNEVWGGPLETYKVLSDSNVDWAQGLKAVESYLSLHRVKDCWFAPFSTYAEPDPEYYGIGCKLLPTGRYQEGQRLALSGDRLDGTLLISASQLSGLAWGPAELNPYEPLREVTPVANIGGSVLVYRGHFKLSQLFVAVLIERARDLARTNQGNEAVAEAREATALAPNMFATHWALADALASANQLAAAREEYRSARSLAQTRHPEFNGDNLLQIDAALRDLEARSSLRSGQVQ